MKTAKVASRALADQINGSQTSDGGVFAVEIFGWGPCTRRSAHSFNCKVDNNGEIHYPDGRKVHYECKAAARVRFKSRRSTRVVWSQRTDPVCAQGSGANAAAFGDARGQFFARRR